MPIRGEAGMGYILEKGFDLPPLMLTHRRNRGGRAGRAMGGRTCRCGAGAGRRRPDRKDRRHRSRTPAPLRAGARQPRPPGLEPGARPHRHGAHARADSRGRKIALRYRDEQGRDSERTIWPIAIGYHEAVRILAAWCELRKDFRSFRTDRVVDAAYLDDRYPERRDVLRAKWRQSLVWEQPKDT